MISWCSYCQTYQGELPPWHRWELSHGVCPACLAADVPHDPARSKAVAAVADFFAELRRGAREARGTSAEVLSRARALGVRPLELLLGLLQPALCDLGQAWEAGEVSIATEHRFSSLVEEVAAELLAEARRRQPPPRPPEFLLLAADGNFHSLGLRLAELFLLSHGRTVTTVFPGLPEPEVAALARTLRPRFLGLSVSLPSQLAAVRAVSAALGAAPGPDAPRLVLGGSLFLASDELPEVPGALVCRQVNELLALPTAGGAWPAESSGERPA